jgi:hypothetical protein
MTNWIAASFNRFFGESEPTRLDLPSRRAEGDCRHGMQATLEQGRRVLLALQIYAEGSQG